MNPSSPSDQTVQKLFTSQTTSYVEQEDVLHGVRCAKLQHGANRWRMGSTNPSWRQEVITLASHPTQEELDAFNAKGIWLADNQTPPPIALMCCGQGSLWPGMGRELYDHFPAARAAMDYIASIAHWDVLGLLDEKDPEVIALTRWQQPYLFLLEYAQWSYLTSLGFKPDIIMGHSLGEVLALCFSGILAPEEIWFTVDTRSQHMAQMEATATHEQGMMAIHAPSNIITEICALFPTLYVSNYNTPTQHILSGPRNILGEARKLLRKRKIPAMILNMTMAFHNPEMRIWRNLISCRLKLMQMRPPQIPFISCTNVDFYPEDKSRICSIIEDIDENAVRWVETVQSVHARGITHFLELGPADVLCGLVRDIKPQTLCLSAGRKGSEAEGMRQTVARLYALGFLPAQRIHALSKQTANTSTLQTETLPSSHEDPSIPLLDDVKQILASIVAKEASAIKAHMDLRHNLGIRSSRFPLIVQEAEQRFTTEIPFEKLLHVVTVGDLAQALHTCLRPSEVKEDTPHTSQPHEEQNHLRRFALCLQENTHYLNPIAFDAQGPFPTSTLPPQTPCDSDPALHQGDHILVIGEMPVLSVLYTAFAALGCHLFFVTPTTPSPQELQRLESLGAHLEIIAAPGQNGVLPALDYLKSQHARMDAVFSTYHFTQHISDAFDKALEYFQPRYALTLDSLEFLENTSSPSLFQAVQSAQDSSTHASAPLRHLWFSLNKEQEHNAFFRNQTAGDMLVRELLYGKETHIVWARNTATSLSILPPTNRDQHIGRVYRSQDFPLTRPKQEDRTSPFTFFEGECHFSCSSDTYLRNQHLATVDDIKGYTVPHAAILEALAQAVLQHQPWLHFIGFGDIRWQAPLPVPEGITRECRIHAHTSIWLQQETNPIRVCPSVFEAQELLPNGRKKATFTTVCHAFPLVTPSPQTISPLWAHPFQPDSITLTAENTEIHSCPTDTTSSLSPETQRNANKPRLLTADLNNFYVNHKLPPEKRLLHHCEALADNFWHATIEAPKTSVALNTFSGYYFLARTFECLLQFVEMTIETQMQRQMHLAGTALLRQQYLPPAEGTHIYLHQTFQDNARVQFDAQIAAENGDIVLLLQGVEYLEACTQ